MSPSNAYTLLQRLSPETMDAVERLLAQGFSPANVARLFQRQARSEIARLIRPAAFYAASIMTEESA